MSDLLNFNNVNWVDGMKVSGEHFRESDLAHESRINDIAALMVAGNRYGVIPMMGINFNNDTCLIKHEQESLGVTIRNLCAITPNGARINLETTGNGVKQVLSTEGLIDNRVYYLVTTVNWKEKVACGEPKTEELPIRIPYLRSFIGLDLVTPDVFNTNRLSQNFIPIAKGLWKDRYFDVNEAYIPPCTDFQAHYSLAEMFAFLNTNLANLENVLSQLLHKLNGIGYQSSLAQSLKQVIDGNMPKLIDVNGAISIQGNELLPHEMATYLIQWLKTCRLSVNTLSGKDRKEFIENLSRWTGFNPGDYEEMLHNISTLSYRHYDAESFWDFVKNFVVFHYRFFEQVVKQQDFKQMKDVDLFVAEKYEEVDVAQETHTPTEEPPEKKKRGWSF